MPASSGANGTATTDNGCTGCERVAEIAERDGIFG
jgi:hypothetical protein